MEYNPKNGQVSLDCEDIELLIKYYGEDWFSCFKRDYGQYGGIAPRVGPFFYIGKGDSGFVVSHEVPLPNAEEYGDFLTTGYSHLKLWDTHRYLRHSPYEDCPRGRVVYSKPEDTFIIYIDKCLQCEEVLQRVKWNFGLKRQSCRVAFDEHYQCAECAQQGWKEPGGEQCTGV